MTHTPLSMLPENSDNIRLQLTRIVQSPPFLRAKRLAELLTYLTEETLSGRGAGLQQETIARAVYDRAEGFSSASESLVRVEISRLRKALDRYYEQFGKDDPWHIGIPLRSYTPVFESHRPPPADRHSPAAGDRAPETWRLPTIQVMPFSVHLLKIEQAIPLALEEVLTTDLSLFPSVRVLANSGAENGEHSNRPGPLALARERELDFTVTGNIWQSKEQVRIELALRDVAVGDQIWSGRFETDLAGTDMLDFLARASRNAAARIADAYGAVMQRMSTHFHDKASVWASTFIVALRFFDMQLMPGNKALDACFEALERAEPMASNSAEYYGMLGFCMADRVLFSDHTHTTTLTLEDSRRIVRLALAMDSTATTSQLARAYLAMLDRDAESILDACERMLRQLPNSGYVQGTAAMFIATTGAYERALAHYQRSMELVPRYPGWFHLTPCFYHYYRGEYQEALREANRINTIDFYWEHLLKASLLAYLGRKQEASSASDALLAAVPDFPARADSIVQFYTLDTALAIKIRRGLQLAGAL